MICWYCDGSGVLPSGSKCPLCKGAGKLQLKKIELEAHCTAEKCKRDGMCIWRGNVCPYLVLRVVMNSH